MAATAFATLPDTASATKYDRPVRVALFGDSLAWESMQPFRGALTSSGRAHVRMSTFGGTAICDFFPQMRQTARWRPDAVVIQFSGNTYTKCVRDAEGRALRGDALVAKYRADAEEAVRIFSAVGARIYLSGSPVMRDIATTGSKPEELNAMYQALAGLRPSNMQFVDAGDAVLDDGEWTATLPCLDGEPCGAGGRNTVRAPDGGHFCPTAGDSREGVTGECPVWSSGAYRFGRAMAEPIIRDFGLSG
jgi:hypothetical protein